MTGQRRCRSGMGVVLAVTITLAGVGLLRADTGSDARPIHLGVSGGSIDDLKATRRQTTCCGGTLGALVSQGGVQYILSNNHVLARGNKGSIGDPVIQPGLIDEAPTCGQDNNDVVANLSQFVPIGFSTPTAKPTNFVDAAIAQVVAGKVRTDGAQATIGVISASEGTPLVGQAVQKDGRSSGHTTGSIQAMNVTARVRYSKVCGGGGGRAKFKQQLLISPVTFSSPGDSGSLIVDTSTPPHAVGLLFAGSDTATIANMIFNVLSANWAGGALGMVGQSGAVQNPFMRWLGALFPAPRVADAASRGGLRAASMLAAERAQSNHEDRILDLSGVAGLGIGAADVVNGDALIEIYVEKLSAAARAALPTNLDGVPVRVIETGEFAAF
jgi:hypothetical protein